MRCAGFSLRGLLLLRSTGSRHTGFSCWGLRALERAGFMSCDSQAPELGLRSCGTQAWLLRSLWGLPRPEIEPVFPALAEFLSTAPPGKPLGLDFFTEPQSNPGDGRGEESERCFYPLKRPQGKGSWASSLTAIRAVRGEGGSPRENGRILGWQVLAARCPWWAGGRACRQVDGRVGGWTCINYCEGPAL